MAVVQGVEVDVDAKDRTGGPEAVGDPAVRVAWARVLLDPKASGERRLDSAERDEVLVGMVFPGVRSDAIVQRQALDLVRGQTRAIRHFKNYQYYVLVG